MSAAPNGKVVVEQAGHLIPQEQPAAVHQVIRDVVEEVLSCT